MRASVGEKKSRLDMSFPALIPSSRRFTPSQFPVTRHKFMTGQKQSMLFASNAYKAELRLVYANRTPTEIALFMAHYDKQDGTHSSFKFPGKWAEQVWGGWDSVNKDEKILAINGRWRYAAPPRITQQRGKVATAEVVLLQVPGTKEVPIKGGSSGSNGCTGASPPQEPGSPPGAPGGPQGPSGNGAGGFPGGPSGGGGGNIGDGGGGGPSGPGGGGGGGAFPGFPGSPIIPPTCPPGYVLKDNKCVPVPGLNPGDLVRIRYQNVGKDYTIKTSSCLSDETGCSPQYVLTRGCFQETAIRWGKWPITLKVTVQGYGDRFIFAPPPPVGETPYGDFGCYSRSLGYDNYNYAGRWYYNPDHKRTVWEYFDAEGTTVSNPIYYTRFGVHGACENSEQAGSEDEPNAEIIEIDKQGVGTIWRSPNYLSQEDCENWNKDPETGQLRVYDLDTQDATRANTPDPGNFPSHTPSRRSMKYGEWNTRKSNPGKSNQAVTLPLPKKSVKNEVILELVYANRADGVARDFMNHYLGSVGEWDDFQLPGEKLKEGPMAGWSVDNADRYLSKGRWAYNRPPLVESVHPNTSTITVQLISLESKAFAGPGPEIKPLKDCECPPPFSPGNPPPQFPSNPNDPDSPSGPTPIPSPGPGKPTPLP